MSDSEKRENHDKRHIFSADRPILNPSEDRLNRTKFSRELAKSISNWTEKDSLVLAVYGQWGDGKSSVKNLTKEVFKDSLSSKPPLVIEFNPWQWSGDDHITEAFFKEIASKLSQSDKETKKIAKKLIEYAEFLELGNELVTKFKTTIQKILAFGAAGTGVLSGFIGGKWQIALVIIAIILSLATSIIDEIVWALKWFDKFRKSSQMTMNLEDKKNELIKSLGKLEHTVIVIIDDIDRLTKPEIKALFKVIKANADFPNIVYLTFFQRDIIENSLDELGVYKGNEYLKKIVQVGFDLPKVPIGDIHKILFKDLDRLLDETKLNQKFEQGRWNELFIEGLSYYFKNLRDVNRFISTFSFHLGIFKNNEHYEINFVDLIGLEVLRQFEPKVYEMVFFSKKLLTTAGTGSSSRFTDDAEKKQMETILSFASKDNEENVKAILKVLFPNAQWAWGANTYSNVGDESAVKLRVNHENFFNRYFSLFLPDEEIPQSDFEYILKITDDEEKLFAFIMQYYDQGRLPLFVKKFEAYKQVVDKSHASSFISAMLRLGDYLTAEDEGFFSISPVTHVRRIIIWYFKKQEFKEDKKEIYWNILKYSKAIFLPIDLLCDEVERRSKDKYPENYVFLDIDIDEIKKLLIQKIYENKDKDDFKENIHLPRILYAWSRVDLEGEKQWFEKFIEDDLNLIDFLIKLESKGHRSSGYEQKTVLRIHLLWLKTFFDNIEQLLSRLRSLEKKGFSDNENAKKVFAHIEKIEDEFLHPEKYKNGFHDEDD